MSDQESQAPQVTLRPAGEDDLPVLEEIMEDPGKTGEFGWFGWHDRARWRRGWEDNRLIGPDHGTLIVAAGDRRLGFVTWHRQQATVAAYKIEIGICLLPEARATVMARRRSGCSPGTSSRTRQVTGSGPGPRQATSPSRKPWSTPGSPGKVLPGVSAGGTAPGATE